LNPKEARSFPHIPVEHRHQLSFEDYPLPVVGKLSSGNRWIKLVEGEDLKAQAIVYRRLHSHYPIAFMLTRSTEQDRIVRSASGTEAV